MEERRKHHHLLTFRHSSFDISSSSDIMRLVPGPGHPQGGAPGGAPITPSCTAGPSHPVLLLLLSAKDELEQPEHEEEYWERRPTVDKNE